MAYTPVNWQTGDTITADRLNRMDRGWGFEETELFSETVTTVVDPDYPEEGAKAELAYSQSINADTITVTYDGTEYTCPSIGTGEYGAPFNGGTTHDFSEFPFNLFTSSGNAAYLTTQTASEHTVSASVAVLQTSPDFDKARGYGYVTGNPTELFSETVTTTVGSQGDPIAQLDYSGFIDADTITVTFDGTEYTCPRIDGDSNYYYGGFDPNNGPDFTTYPFFIWSSGGTNQLITKTAGEHTIAVVAAVTSMKTSSDFATAVNAHISTAPMLCISGTTYRAEIEDAIAAGKLVYFWTSNHGCFFITKAGRPFTIFPESSEVTATHNGQGLLIITES